MAKIVLTQPTSGYNLAAINLNFQKIQDEFQNKVLYRNNPVGEVNTLSTTLDINAQRIINLAAPQSSTDAARLADVQDAIAGVATAALTTFSPTGSISSNNVQGAIAELDGDITNKATKGANSDITSLSGISAGGIPLAAVAGAIGAGGNIGAATATTPAAADNDTSVATTAFVQGELTAQSVKLTGAQTVVGVKTFSDKPIFSTGFGSGNTNQSCVRVHTSNGFGSTNTKIRRFTTTALSQGTDITYADSATLGALFTINVAGVYAISYTDSGNVAHQLGVSLNGSALTTNIANISASERIVVATTSSANSIANAATAIYLPASSLIRPHSDGVPVGTTDNTQFTITRLS